MRDCIVLTSGGLDSTVTMAIARSRGFTLNALSFEYGQRHRVELDCARRIAAHFACKRQHIARLDLGAIGGSALTDPFVDVPCARERTNSNTTDIPPTYVPARNIIFLSYALAWGEVIGASDIFIGVTSVDYSGYPDRRPAFIHAFETAANLGTRLGNDHTKAPVTIHTPLIAMTKAQIIRTGHDLGVDFSMTHSCYNPRGEYPCTVCDSCVIRARGFAEAGLVDTQKRHTPDVSS